MLTKLVKLGVYIASETIRTTSDESWESIVLGHPKFGDPSVMDLAVGLSTYISYLEQTYSIEYEPLYAMGQTDNIDVSFMVPFNSSRRLFIFIAKTEAC